MRTTVNLDDDVLETARGIAYAERRPLGTVISELIRRGLAPRAQTVRTDQSFPTFSVPVGAASITPEMVRSALDEP